MKLLLNSRFKTFVSSIGLGALFVLTYAPFSQAWLGILVLTLSFSVLHRLSFQASLLPLFGFGLGYYGLGISWVFVSINTFVEPPLFAILITLGLVIFMSGILTSSLGLLQKLTPPSRARLLFYYPLGAMLYEWLMMNHILHFPWLTLGSAMIDTPLSAYAPMTSVMGVSYLAYLSAGLLATYDLRFLIFASFFWIASFFISGITWTQSTLEKYTVSAIQGNINVATKWDPQHLSSALRTMVKLTEAHWDSDWIIWSENALAALYADVEPFIHRLAQEAKIHHSAVVLGLPIQEKEIYFNSAIALGEGAGRYDKYELVPFGEYTPFEEWLLPLLSHFQIPMSNFSPGPWQQKLLILKDQPVALFSCFETIFFEYFRSQFQGAKAILIISDDAWFGHSFAAYQQFQMSRMRAKELGRQVLTVGNTGITALIDAQGEVQQQLKAHRRDVLSASIELYQGETPWVRYGVITWLALIISMNILLGIVIFFSSSKSLILKPIKRFI